MKKKALYWLYASVVVVVLALCLVVPKLIKSNKENDFNKGTETEEYATSFSLNLPDIIYIYVGTKVNLKTGYVNVTPSHMLEKLNIEVKTKENLHTSGITLKNNQITANEVGKYSIIFKIPKSASSNFAKTISVNVYEEKENSHVYKAINSIEVTKSLEIEKAFTIKENLTYSTITDDKVKIENGLICAEKLGESNITFVFIEQFIEYVYDFKLTVKELPRYEIVLKNVTENRIEINIYEDDVFQLQYQVVDGGSGDISQDVNVEVENEQVATTESGIDQFIKIIAHSKGETIITISYVLDSSITVEVMVVVL